MTLIRSASAWVFGLLLSWPTCGAMAATEAPTVVRYAGAATPAQQALHAFPAALLALCLDKSGNPYRLEVVPGFSAAQSPLALESNAVDVISLPSIASAIPGIRPVKLPLRRGLLGVRLLLATPSTAERLAQVETTAALRRDFKMGYGQDWFDARAMQRLGFRMTLEASYPALFEGIRQGRFDYLSRGVNEVLAEMEDPALAGSGLVIVPGLALYYPLDDFFWARTGSASLRRDIEQGFRAALADGSYTALFDRFHAETMALAGISERSVMHVLGYPVPEGTPLELFDVLQLTRSQGRLAFPMVPENPPSPEG